MVRQSDNWTVLSGIVREFRTGVAWRDVLDRYGSWATLHNRFRRWAKTVSYVVRRTYRL
ncbi:MULTISPECIES: transposase [unclassified Streptomyces]|uniref:transposase n=1 Tax=unclassified Streptomyces TaxID=2593676 RepID=UPI00131D2428